MATIVALIHGKAGAYGIGFPDFRGAVSGGATLDEALGRGRDTLTAHVAAFVQAGLDLPPIRTLDEIKADPACAEDLADAALVAAVTVDLPGKAVRLNISMDEALVARIDAAARARGESRSRFLAEAARARLAS